MKNIKISRAKWLRGEGGDESYLLREGDGKMCCLGQYLKQCKIRSTDLLNIYSPDDSYIEQLIPKQAKWLMDEDHLERSKDCSKMMAINDSQKTKDKQKEEKLIKYFAKNNVAAEFVD